MHCYCHCTACRLVNNKCRHSPGTLSLPLSPTLPGIFGILSPVSACWTSPPEDCTSTPNSPSPKTAHPSPPLSCPSFSALLPTWAGVLELRPNAATSHVFPGFLVNWLPGGPGHAEVTPLRLEGKGKVKEGLSLPPSWLWMEFLVCFQIRPDGPPVVPSSHLTSA